MHAVTRFIHKAENKVHVHSLKIQVMTRAFEGKHAHVHSLEYSSRLKIEYDTLIACECKHVHTCIVYSRLKIEYDTR